MPFIKPALRRDIAILRGVLSVLQTLDRIVRRVGFVLVAAALFAPLVLAQTVRPKSTATVLPQQKPGCVAATHAPVSSHVRIRAKSLHAPVVRRVSFAATATPIIANHATTISGTSGKILIDVAIGQPILTTNKATRSKTLVWPRLTHAPNGLTLEPTSAKNGMTPMLAVTVAVPPNAKTFAPIFEQVSTVPIKTQFSSKAGRISIGAPHTFRSLRTVTIQIPLLRNGTALTKFRVGVQFATTSSAPTTPLPASAAGDRLFAGMNAHLVANTWDLAQFAMPMKQNKNRAFALATPKLMNRNRTLAAYDSTAFGWIDTTADYVKLSVTRDGLYRVPTSDMTAAQHGWTAANLRCINRGAEIPIWIDTDATGAIAAIEFYGEHLHGVPLNDSLPEWYNLSTDTNCYWLTSSGKTGGTPLRYKPIVPAAPQTSRITGAVALHHERDYFYYDGDAEGQDEFTIHPSTYTPGERFEWYELHSPLYDQGHSVITDTFFVSGPSATTTASLKVLARGMTAGQHHVIVRINGTIVHDRFFSDFNEDTVTSSFPASVLVAGANIFQATIAPVVGDTIDEFYFDHYDLTFDANLAPNADTTFAPGQYRFSESLTTPYTLILLDSTPHLYNLTDGTRLVYRSTSSGFNDAPQTSRSNYAASPIASMLACNRIETIPRTSWNLLNPNNRADYIIITYPDFLLDAQLLAARRAMAGLASMVVTTDQVYNAFDYGSGEPDALRRFLSYAYFFYNGQQSVPVGYVTLFGAGTWDPKFNLNNRYQPSGSKTIFPTLVPTYGWPTSDFYFTLAEDGNLDTIQPRMVIARIPVRNSAEADAYVRKLQEYEDNPPAHWNRDWLFLAGGSGYSQHEEFVQQDSDFMETNGIGMAAPPTNVRYNIIQRDSTLVQDPANTTPDPSHVGEIQQRIENGLGLLYFGGHGATFTSDILLPDAYTLHNAGLYPFLFTVSCRTGAFGEPNIPTINASYIEQPEAGSAFAFGTTGFGELDYDGTLSLKCFDLMRHWREDGDYLRLPHDTTMPMRMNLTAMLTAAKLFASDSEPYGRIGENLRWQYSALGDAAIGFALRPQPELAVHANDISTFTDDSVPRTVFSVSDSAIDVSTLVYNYGYAAETPVVVRIEDAPPTGPPADVFDTLPRLDDSARVGARFHLTDASIGEHTITVSIDPGRHFRPLETDSGDDDASTRVLVNGLSATPFYPWEGARNVCDVSGQRVHFIMLFPPHLASHVQLQLDTSLVFSSPFITRDTVVGAGYYGTLDVSLAGVPVPSTSVYWWRTRIVRTTGDTSAWQYASFNTSQATATAPRAEFSYSSVDQLGSTITNGLVADPAHGLFLPIADTTRYDVLAHGAEDSGLPPYVTFSNLYVNGKLVENYEQKQGYVLVTLTPDRSRIDSIWEFSVVWTQLDSAYNTAVANAIDSVIARIPDSTATIFFTGWQPAAAYITGAGGTPDLTRSALQTLGAKNGIDNIPFFASYIMLGKKGLPPGMAREVFGADKSSGAQLSDTEVTSGTSGSALTPFTAIARAYGKLRATASAPNGSDILLSVLGSRRDGTGIDRLDSLHASQSSTLDLSKIDPRTYDKLGLRMDFSRQSTAAKSPELHAVELEYDAAPEFIFTADTLVATPPTVTQGSSVIVPYVVQTLTCDSALNVIVALTGNNISANDTLSHAIATLAGHAVATINDTINTLRETGLVPILATVNPNEAQNEQLLFNNTIAGSFTVTRDTTLPRAEVLLDNNRVAPCGYASRNAVTTINLYSTNTLRVLDSNSIKVTFQGDSGYYAEVGTAKPQVFTVKFVTPASGPLQAQLIVTPANGFQFGYGQWNITATVKDASGNVDTVAQCFTISATNGLDHVMNYPNPFKDNTWFTFELRSDAQADVKVIIYTVAGRKIRTLTPTTRTHAGFNTIEWDGRDTNGNAVGNGTYLYRVAMSGKNPDGSDASGGVTEKAVRSR